MASEGQASRGCGPWSMKEKHRVGVGCDQWEISVTCGCVGVIRQYKIEIWGLKQILVAVPTPDSHSV